VRSAVLSLPAAGEDECCRGGDEHGRTGDSEGHGRLS